MVNRFNWCGFDAANNRKNKVLEVCRLKGWELLCMQPGKRYVIKVGHMKYYWTYDEILKKGDVANGTNRLGNLQVGGNSVLDSGLDNKVSVVRRTGRI